MKKIGIDARLYSQTGVGVYLKNLLYYLEKTEIKNELYYVYLMSEDYQRLTFKNKQIIKRQANYRWHRIEEQVGFALKLYFDNLDLMHFTYFSYPVFYFKKFVSTVHDVTLLLFMTGKASTKNKFVYKIKHFIFEKVLNQQVSHSIKIITPSETVKNQLVKIYGPKIAGKIKPLYEGINYQVMAGEENKKLEKQFDNFFIYVGNFYPHKNVEKLIESFKTIDKKYQLILLGPDDYFSDRIAQEINDLKLNNIFLFKNPSLSDLIFFYRNALALVHPSLSEGFGLPLIEAAYFNLPVIASDIQVFKELLGNNYLSFNPNDVDDMSNKIKKFLVEKPHFDYKDLIKKYSFKKMTSETVKIYKKVLYHEKSNNQESRHRL
jgi:glycosyltransferase involved in cell wall biosynthesis